MEKQQKTEFQKEIYSFFEKEGRVFPWRKTKNPYCILVSEVMLQQTQAGERTMLKYGSFLECFPTVESLAQAPLRDVLVRWQGLGYNRRAKALHESAKIIIKEHNGKVPKSRQALERLPGVGPYTAAAVCTFAFNQPVVMLETNIRSVFIHHFFENKKQVSDKEILPLVAQTLDEGEPHRWYSALMDYGAHLKKQNKALNKKSKHYTRQSTFEGSDRQIRGEIIKILAQNGPLTAKTISQKGNMDSKRVQTQLNNLHKEGMIQKIARKYSL